MAERFKKGDRVVVKKTGEEKMVEGDYGPKFHPPYLLEDGKLYFGEELEAVSDSPSRIQQ